MIVKASKSDLLSLLSQTQSLIEKRTSLQTLLNVLIEVSQKETSMEVISQNRYLKESKLSLGALKFFATNLEVGFVGEMRAFVYKPCRLAVNAKSLFEVIRELPGEEVFLTSKENEWLQVQQGRSIFNIAGISPEGFPNFPNFKGFEFVPMDPLILKTMIEKTLYCVSVDDTRRHLSGVFFEKISFDEEGEFLDPSKKNKPSFKMLKNENQSDFDKIGYLKKEEIKKEARKFDSIENQAETPLDLGSRKSYYRMVAMSTHRLSFVEREMENPLLEKLKKGVIIPKKGLLELNFFLNEAVRRDQMVEVFINEAQFIVRFNKSFLMIHLINDRYPNYKRLVPKDMKNEVVLSRKLFLDSLKRVSVLCHKESGFVSLGFKEGKLELTSGDTDLGSAKEELDISYVGEAVEIGFNVHYIMDTLKSIKEDEISLVFSNSSSPGIIQPLGDTSHTSVIMPMSFPSYN